MTDADGPFVRLDDIVSKADVIVYGTVVGVEARLSGDQRHVVTDYQVVEGLTISEGVAYNSRRVTLKVGDQVVVMGTVERHMLTLSSLGVFTVVDGAVKANGTVEGFIGTAKC